MFRALAFCLILGLSSCLTQPAYAAETCLHDCQVDDEGYVLIKTFEGYSPFIYKDAIGIPTVGFGHVILPGEDINTPLMGPEAFSLLQRDVNSRSGRLNALIQVPLSASQFNALASLSYNIGLGNIQRSTLLRRVNAGRHEEVPPQFLVWDRAGGKVLTGLLLRRKVEAKLYEKDIGD
jgi:lysozyme